MRGPQLLADRKVDILMLGFSGSGKTLLLASLYHCFATAAGRDPLHHR